MYVATKEEFCCPRNQGLGLECTRDHFFKVLVLVLVLPAKVLVLPAKVLVLVLVLPANVLVLVLLAEVLITSLMIL